jgi:hypothetical protein
MGRDFNLDPSTIVYNLLPNTYYQNYRSVLRLESSSARLRIIRVHHSTDRWGKPFATA